MGAEGTAEVHNKRAAAARSSKICFREGWRACKENNIGSVEAAFFDGLDDGWFAACFGEGACNDFFIKKAEISGSKTGFFEKRFKFGTEERRSAGNDDSGGSHGLSGNSIPACDRRAGSM